MFSESPPLSGDKPPTDIEKRFLAMRCMERRNASLFAGRIQFRRVNSGKTTGFAKVKLNEIRLKHRSEEIRNRYSLLNELFREYSNVSVV